MHNHHHHHHHNYASIHSRHRRHHIHHHSHVPQTGTGDVTPKTRGRFLGVSIFISAVITAAAIAFMVVSIVMFSTTSALPKLLLIPFIAVPVLMIVIAVVSLVRSIRVYKSILPQEEASPIAGDSIVEESDPLEEEDE